MYKNFNIEEIKEEIYKDSRIVAWRESFEVFDQDKKKDIEVKNIICQLYREGSRNQPLNLGECNNGAKFTAVNQAINQAKQIVNFYDTIK